MASHAKKRPQNSRIDTYEQPSTAFAVPVDITDRDAEGEDDWSQADRATQEAISKEPTALGTPLAIDSPGVTPVAKATRPTKRKLAETQAALAAPGPVQDSSTLAIAPQLLAAPLLPPVSGFYFTRGHPINKPNFRYVPCGPSPGSSLLYPLYRVIPSPPAHCVRFSWEDRSQYLAISEDALSVTADKGFRSVRANVPMREGTWYFEVSIERGGGSPGGWQGGGAHIRLGVGRRESPLTAPVGFDGYSYGLRDKTGDVVTLSQTKPYGPPFGTGDVIGVLLKLPPRRTGDPHDADDPAHLKRKRIPIRYKGQLYFESLEYPSTREMGEVLDALHDRGKKKVVVKVKAAAPGTRMVPQYTPPPSRPLYKLEGSSIEFYKNGEPLGTAFEDLYDYLPLRAHARPRNAKPIAPGSDASRENHHDDGSLGYYPFVSCYGGGQVRLIPGPHFAFPLPPGARPLSERYDEYAAETLELDERDEAELRSTIEAEAQEAAKRQKPSALQAPIMARPQLSEGAASPFPSVGTPDDGMIVDEKTTQPGDLAESHMDVDETLT